MGRCPESKASNKSVVRSEHFLARLAKPWSQIRPNTLHNQHIRPTLCIGVPMMPPSYTMEGISMAVIRIPCIHCISTKRTLVLVGQRWGTTSLSRLFYYKSGCIQCVLVLKLRLKAAQKLSSGHCRHLLLC